MRLPAILASFLTTSIVLIDEVGEHSFFAQVSMNTELVWLSHQLAGLHIVMQRPQSWVRGARVWL